ncbi:hypothetical protein TVAG_076400 [Trichomonas vaginalis G3]|uniref:Uncharacterized protein n=1 Tax=Trichomonas vaginalis (strain ATCC PRA-98 / G3) TaxID=412133 RepID=A2D9N7_TRIV3|nr:spectrin binding [Trichomonas vaginalis G3]EAY22893.1 hypothetical protein TVAG_076400 [Trichomonas vaginalis G3]KAI5527391.1 spectrin binding [Trichomonas vaginalis G3]|eukprot:XP_001583879.1 hypothetical protein [Trichomonas vaginalis G3]
MSQALFTNFRIPEKMVPYVNLQDILNGLSLSNIDNAVKYISANFTPGFYEELILNIIHFSEIRPNLVKVYSLLCSMLLTKLEPNFKPILFRLSKGIFLRYLFLEGIYSLEDIQSKCKQDLTQYFYFAPELDIPKECEEITKYGSIYKRYYELRKDNWRKYKDLLELGFDRGTLRFSLRYDDVDLLVSLSSDPTWTLSKKLFPSPFENSYPMSMLAFAARYGSERCFKWLLDKGATFDAEVPENIIIGGNMNLFNILTQKKTNFKHELVTAAKYFRMDIADWLLVNSDNSEVFISNLIESCNYRTILYFVTPQDMTDAQIGPWTPLCRAAAKGLLSLCVFFVYLGAQVNPRHKEMPTPLHACSQSGYIEVCRFMVQNGAKIDAKDDNRNTPLYIASSKNNFEIVQFLLQNKAQINTTNEDHKTALVAATESGANEVVQLLLESGADPNITDQIKRTAIHYAVENKNAEATLLLVRNGADTKLRDEEGQDPFDLCYSSQVKQALCGKEPTNDSGWLSYLWCRIN